MWSISKKQLLLDLPGHADEVFAVDWSPDGEKVASGGRDRLMKMLVRKTYSVWSAGKGLITT